MIPLLAAAIGAGGLVALRLIDVWVEGPRVRARRVLRADAELLSSLEEEQKRSDAGRQLASQLERDLAEFVRESQRPPEASLGSLLKSGAPSTIGMGCGLAAAVTADGGFFQGVGLGIVVINALLVVGAFALWRRDRSKWTERAG